MAVKHLTDKNSDGTCMGQDADDKISFHGATPTDQPAAISDVSVTGTYAAYDDAREAAGNGIR
ncbi:MAG: hypothetical protein MK186_13000, partial [Henriciella sp.]|nr:hypothetical protein [Henriciella sp.]